MKTRIEWRHGARVLKLDDTDYEVFPESGDIVELEEDGETHRFTVKSIETAVIELEVAPDDAEVTHPDGQAISTPPSRALNSDQKQAAQRKAERLAAEQSAEKQRTRKFKVTPSKKKK